MCIYRTYAYSDSSRTTSNNGFNRYVYLRMRDYVRAYDALSITVTLDQSLHLGRGPLHTYLCVFICLSVSVFLC
jgi:hypothetical protein